MFFLFKDRRDSVVINECYGSASHCACCADKTDMPGYARWKRMIFCKEASNG